MTTKTSITMKGLDNHEDSFHIIMPDGIDWRTASGVLSISGVTFYVVYLNKMSVSYDRTRVDLLDVAAQCLLIAASIIETPVPEVDLEIIDSDVDLYEPPGVKREILLRATEVPMHPTVPVEDMVVLGPLPAYALRSFSG